MDILNLQHLYLLKTIIYLSTVHLASNGVIDTLLYTKGHIGYVNYVLG